MAPNLMTSLFLALPIVALVWLVVWELDKLSGAQKCLPLHPSVIHHIDLIDLARSTPLPLEKIIKETPATSQLHIPPPVFAGYVLDHKILR